LLGKNLLKQKYRSLDEAIDYIRSICGLSVDVVCLGQYKNLNVLVTEKVLENLMGCNLFKKETTVNRRSFSLRSLQVVKMEEH
jgi:hypothetical protein